ncbi:MAG TPA: hypothetical protein VGQ37_02350 [Vicinamibacterales bacterium]|jgi:hypothetical protein|nr:hypothetical protein [Vicinamibacterales bacterium]
MPYEGDAFISYAHLDNRVLSDGQTGWVASLQRALETRVAQLAGREAHVWWDPELRGNEVFSDILIDRLRKVAALVPIVSPGYINSKWGRRELTEFCRAAEEHGGLKLGDQARVFKVLKTLVPLEQHPPELQPFLGYEFYKIDPDTGRVREMSEIFGPEAEQEFLLKLDDLAHDLCRLLEEIHDDIASSFVQPQQSMRVYLGETTNDLRPQRDSLRRALQQHGYTVLPARTLPLVEADLSAAVRQDLASCRMSIHMFGGTYGVVPEGAEVSLQEIQSEIAAERRNSGPFSQLLWIPQGLSVTDDRQRHLLDRLRLDRGMRPDTDLLETSFEDLRTLIAARLKESQKPAPASTVPAAKPGMASLYFVYDQRDEAAIAPWSDLLFQSFEIVHPLFEGDERDVREAHEDALRQCDGVLLFYGNANEPWLRRKLTEVQKSPGNGRTKPAPELCVVLAPPRTPAKERFRTHYCHVVAQWTGCDAAALQPFVDTLSARGRESSP